MYLLGLISAYIVAGLSALAYFIDPDFGILACILGVLFLIAGASEVIEKFTR